MSPPEPSPSDGVTSSSEARIVIEEQVAARRHGSWTLQFRYGEQDIDGRRSACSCGARGDWREEAGQCAVDQAEHLLKAAREAWSPKPVPVTPVTTWTSPSGEVWVQPGHRPDVPYEGYDGLSNYVTPFPPGTRLQVERGTSLRFSDVTRVEGYAPDVVEMDGRGTSLRGTLITVLRAACLGLPEHPNWPGCEGIAHHPLCPLADRCEHGEGWSCCSECGCHCAERPPDAEPPPFIRYVPEHQGAPSVVFSARGVTFYGASFPAKPVPVSEPVEGGRAWIAPVGTSPGGGGTEIGRWTEIGRVYEEAQQVDPWPGEPYDNPGASVLDTLRTRRIETTVTTFDPAAFDVATGINRRSGIVAIQRALIALGEATSTLCSPAPHRAGYADNVERTTLARLREDTETLLRSMEAP